MSDRTPEILRGAIPVPAGMDAATAAMTQKADADIDAAPMGKGWMVTTLDQAVAWGRKNALWPYAFGTACCAIEFMGTVDAHYDLARFGAEVLRFSPRQADMMIVAGTITDKMGPVLRKVYEQMLEPKYVIAMGVCASSGGFYRSYHVMQGIDEVVPVDIYVPGCPPTPEGLIDAIIKLQQRIQKGENARAVDRRIVPAGQIIAKGGTH